ncbi:MAG: DNA repair protein RecN [Phycisphaeraceae bacterium]
MLRELHISNLAVIEDVTITFAAGLNCFTGQTGAGKSLILGALEILLGLRGGALDEMIRPGAEEARVSGVFELHDADITAQIAQAADQALHPGDDLLVTRKVFASGRSSVSINGHPAAGAMVRRVAELLVDVHGQHDHQYLLKPSNQLLILDAFGQTMPLRARFHEVHGELRALRQRHAELSASRTLRQQQLELYEFQADEIDKADLREGELAELRARHVLLSNVQRIKREAGTAHAALYESEGAVIERLQMIAHVLGDLAELDGRIKETAEQVRGAALTLQESAYELGRYVDGLELDPGELAQIEERLNALNRLAAKYADHGGAAAKSASGDAIAIVLQYRQEIGEQIAQLRGQDEDVSTLKNRIDALAGKLVTIGGELTAGRKAAAARIRPLIETQMRELGMGEAEFDVAFETAGEGNETSPAKLEDSHDRACPAGDAGASGLDRTEMMVRTNPGQPARPLRKIASGGELSRIMLAIKSILAQSDRISVLVFDEIDANIGGRMGTVIGQKLRRLAGQGDVVSPGLRRKKSAKPQPPEAAASHQVLCITHLPQIAAFAQRHFRIAKEVVGKGANKETRTTVTMLDGKPRIEELAEMLAGKDVTETTRRQVHELLETATV